MRAHSPDFRDFEAHTTEIDFILRGMRATDDFRSMLVTRFDRRNPVSMFPGKFYPTPSVSWLLVYHPGTVTIMS